jgi:hypothetical protein
MSDARLSDALKSTNVQKGKLNENMQLSLVYKTRITKHRNL